MYWPKFCIAASFLFVIGCSKTDPQDHKRGSDDSVMLEDSHEHYHVHSVDVSHEHEHQDDEFTGHGHEHSHPEEASQEQDEESPPQ